MNSPTRILVGLLGWAWWGGVIGLVMPSAAYADESRLPLPASPSGIGHQDAKERPAAERPRPALEQAFRIDDGPTPRPMRVVAGSLALVLGALALFLVCFRRRPATLCSGAMETLGMIQVDPRVRLHLVRLGSRILLLHLTPDKVERVAEITDPGEVQDLLAAHEGESRKPNSYPSGVSPGLDLLSVRGAGTVGNSEQ